jgi:putative transposase
LMDEAKAEVLAFTAFPRAHWSKIWSTDESVNAAHRMRLRHDRGSTASRPPVAA